MYREKRIAMILALLMIASLLPAPAYAAEPAQGWADIYGRDALVGVTFTGVAPEVMQYIILMDEQGQIISPVSEAGGSYRVAAGRYAFGFHDPQGRYADLRPEVLTIDDTMAEVEVALTLARTSVVPQVETPQQPSVNPADDRTQGDSMDPAQLVSVFFRCTEVSDFSRLTVYDAYGNSVRPLTDSATGRVLYDSYLLTPGQYSYRFQDPSGHYTGIAANFTVEGFETQFINLNLTASLTGQGFSGSFINPVYSGLISEADLPSSSVTPEQSLARLQQIVDILSAPAAGTHVQNAVYGAPDTKVYDSIAAAGSALKSALLQRQPQITVLYGCGEAPTEETWRRLCMAVYDAAIVHNGVSTEGDYLRYEYGGVNCDGAVTSTVLPGVYVYEFIYSPLYFTDAAQEAELAGVSASILANLGVAQMDSAHKISAIYRYLCENVSYDSSRDNIVFTAYDALVNGRAVCQGVATAFYRLCLEAGVDARVVTDVGSRHAWNIATPDGSHYFALDATWDAGTTADTQQYFLKGTESWLRGHPYGDQFSSGSFGIYDFPTWDYVMTSENTSGDSEAVINSVSLLFDGMLRIKYYFTFSNRLKNTVGAYLSFRKSGVEVQRVPITAAKEEEGRSCFYFNVNVSDIADPIQVLVVDEDGRNVEIRSRSNTPYPTGFFFSPMEYAGQMKQSGTTEGMRVLAEALEDYGTAAQIYFKGSGYAGLSIDPAIRSISASDLSAWEIKTSGTKPYGLLKASISVMFEADNSLRLYFSYDGSANPFAYSYKLDGESVPLSQRSDGACYLSVGNISADRLDVVHQFSISDGVNTYTVSASVLGYAKTAIERGSVEAADLGRALYLYNRAAKAYFG